MIQTDGEIYHVLGLEESILCDYTTQSNLQIQCNPYQTTNGIFHRTRTKNFIICMETQKTPNSQSNLEKEKWSWRNQARGLQTILQSYSNQDSMVLAQNHKDKEVPKKKKNKTHPPKQMKNPCSESGLSFQR